MIHPSATISNQAKLGKNVQIGPYSIIGPEVTIGDNSLIGSSVEITGKVTIGKNNQILKGVAIGFPAQDLGEKPENVSIEIGDNNIFREYCTVNLPKLSHQVTKIGSNCFFLATVHIAHDCVVGDHVTIANNTMLAGHVQIHSYVFVSGAVGFHQWVRVGSYAMIGGISKVTQDVPPFCLVATKVSPYGRIHGLNSVGLRKSPFSAQTRKDLKEAFKIFFLRERNRSVTLEKLAKFISELSGEAKEQVTYFRNFISESKRGVLPHTDHE